MTPDEKRLEDLARVHSSAVIAHLARRVTPREDAGDIWQDVMTTVWRKIRHVPSGQEAALCWLLAVARRKLANHTRGAQRRLAATDRLRDNLTVGVDTVYEMEPAGTALIEALDQLDEADREVLTLAYWEGLTGEQIGAVIGVSAPSARKRLQRARERLHSALEGSLCR